MGFDKLSNEAADPPLGILPRPQVEGGDWTKRYGTKLALTCREPALIFHYMASRLRSVLSSVSCMYGPFDTQLAATCKVSTTW